MEIDEAVNRREPVLIAAIPGIGIVRARSLAKAGYDTVDSLREVTVEQLAAVPGISEAKAREIVDFIQSMKPVEPPADPPRLPRPRKPARKANSPSAPPPDTGRARAPDTPAEAIRALGNAAAAALNSPHAAELNKALARQLGRLVAATEAAGAHASPGERAGSRIEKLTSRLRKLSESRPPRAGKQEKLAARVRSERKRLADREAGQGASRASRTAKTP